MADDRPTIARTYTPTALPSVTARILAFVAIVLGGLCGALIGWSVTDLQCGRDSAPVVSVPVDGEAGAPGAEGSPAPAAAEDADDGCTTWAGLGAVAGAVIAGGGVAVVAVLVLRAMAEWRRELES